MTILELGERPRRISRRGLLIGGGAGLGLLVAWTVWPRRYAPNLAVAEGEHVFNGYLKIASGGQVTVVVPEVETGQGSYTVFAQIVADELGADWRTIGIEPAPLSPFYADAAATADWPMDIGDQLAEAISTPPPQVTSEAFAPGSFEQRAREAGAAARALLCRAAGKRWGADWRACDTAGSFVVLGNERLRFGELAEDAARYDVPDKVPLRTNQDNRLIYQSLPRLDAPAKVDGSANFAGDIRLPGMVYAALRAGPLGDTRFDSIDSKAIEARPDVERVITRDRWVAVVARSWWAAEAALNAVRPRFKTVGKTPDSKAMNSALEQAFTQTGVEMAAIGDVDALFANARLHRADYSVGLAPHVSLEPMTATAMEREGRLELWLPTQAPGLARRAAADAIGFSPDDVIVHPVMVGGSFGRAYETEAAAQAAILAIEMQVPVQLIWSRAEDMMQDRFGPPAKARMFARMGPAGQIEAWRARVSTPDALAELKARIADGETAFEAQKTAAKASSHAAVSGAVPPYALSNVSVMHHPVDIGVPVGKLRGGADRATVFARESFIDELSKESGVEAFSFRMAMMGGNPRLATCLSKVAVLGGWEGGGAGTQQGLACHAMQNSYIAVLAEAYISEDQRIVVPRLYAVADVGRILHPDIALQQVQGGLLFGLAAALGNAVDVNEGIAHPLRIGDLALPTLADCPDIRIEIIPSREPSGGWGEIGVPAVAPAVANALWAGSGRRFRSLPLLPRNR